MDSRGVLRNWRCDVSARSLQRQDALIQPIHASDERQRAAVEQRLSILDPGGERHRRVAGR